MRKTLLLFLFILVAGMVYADASRFVLTAENNPGTAGGNGVSVNAKIFKDTNQTAISSGENAEFRIRNARNGDKCDKRDIYSNSGGYIYATCYASQTGNMTVYVHSNDRNDDSSDMVLTFNTQPTNTPTPTKTPTPTEEATPTQEPESSPILSVEGITDTPTPTPGSAIASFFSKPANAIAVGVLILALVALLIILVRAGIIKLPKFKKKNPIPPFTSNPPENNTPPPSPTPQP